MLKELLLIFLTIFRSLDRMLTSLGALSTAHRQYKWPIAHTAEQQVSR
jgi:hypothetical protein